MPPEPKRSNKLGDQIMTAKYRASEPQFQNDFHADGTKMFCNFCNHSVEWRKRDTCVDHLKSKKHLAAKAARSGVVPTKKQSTLTGPRATTCTERGSFQEDFVRMMATANIPLEKTTVMKPFFRKHCSQGGSLTTPENLRNTYLPRVYNTHFEAVKAAAAGKKVSVIADETTDHRDKIVLNVIVSYLDKLYLIDTVFMDQCNGRTLSQHVLKSLTSVGIEYDDVVAFVTDNAAYCKTAFEILKNLLPNAIHVGCMAHILNLVGEDFVKREFYKDVDIFVNDIKNIFKRQPQRKKCFVDHMAKMENLPEDIARTVLPEPCATRWGTWFNAAEYHGTHLDVYESFFAEETSTAGLMERCREALAESKQTFLLKMNFISECAPKLQHTLTKLEGNEPFAATIYNTVDDISTYLMQGSVKVLFGEMTDACLNNFNLEDKQDAIDHFHSSFSVALVKLSKHTDNSAAIYEILQIVQNF